MIVGKEWDESGSNLIICKARKTHGLPEAHRNRATTMFMRD